MKRYMEYCGKKMTLQEAIEAGAGSLENIKKAIYEKIGIACALQKPFGETVADIMKMQGITKKKGEKEILDIGRACDLTGLNRNIFYTNMYKPDCVIDMALVVSISIGFKLGPILTQRLLQAAGLAFRLENPNHIAYIYILENCGDLTIEECNEVLESLGVKKTKRLGSYERKPI